MYVYVYNIISLHKYRFVDPAQQPQEGAKQSM